MAFLLRFAAPALESVGLGSVGRIATKITNPLTHAIGGMFNFGKNMVGSVFGGLSGAVQTVATRLWRYLRVISEQSSENKK